MILHKKQTLLEKNNVNSPVILDTNTFKHFSEVFLHIIVTQDFKPDDNALSITIQLSDSSDSSDKSANESGHEILIQTAPIGVQKLKTGYVFRLNRIPLGTKRYIFLTVTKTTEIGITQGKIDVHLATNYDDPYSVNQMVRS